MNRVDGFFEKEGVYRRVKCCRTTGKLGKHHFVNAWTTAVKTGTKGKCLFVCPNYEN